MRVATSPSSTTAATWSPCTPSSRPFPSPVRVARYCAKTQLTERGDVAGNGEDYAGRELTLDCLGVDGVTMTEYVAFTTPAPVAAVASSKGGN